MQCIQQQSRGFYTHERTVNKAPIFNNNNTTCMHANITTKTRLRQ